MKTVLTFYQTVWITIISVSLTAIFNLVFNWLKIKFEWFDSTKKFKRDYYNSQLKELYLELYAIVCQSEYLRYIHKIENDIEKIPFLEVASKKYQNKLNLIDGSEEVKTFELKDVITEFNKEKIQTNVFDNMKYASQDLIKLVAAYRYVHKYYLDSTIEKEMLDKFQSEELSLICKIVKLIIKETNEKLKFCNMDYNELELIYERLNTNIYRALN